MLSKNQIISELYVSHEFNECISKMHPEDLRDDLRSEVILILLETPEERLKQIYQSGGLKFFAVRIILNQIQSVTSSFYKKYRQQMSELTDEVHDRVWREECGQDSIDDRLHRELTEERAIGIIDNLYWYDREIVKLYVDLGSYREIEKVTGIKWQSCYDTVQSAIGQIRYQLRTNPIKSSTICQS